MSINSIYIISPIKEGGSNKYINDLLKLLKQNKKKYIIINNKKELDTLSSNFSNNNILIVQNLINTNIKFIDIENIVNNTQINLILPIHDFYFIYSNENMNNMNINIHEIPTIKSNHNLLKLAKYVIFPSQFMLDKFIEIEGSNNNYIFIPHNDNININNTYNIYIPPILNNQINIGIITNINETKGYSYYKKLCYINKLFYEQTNKKYVITYYIFGHVDNNKLLNHYIHRDGIYKEDNIYNKLNEKNIHGLMFLNKFPETYCYALTKGINTQLPILYTDIGAVGERLRNINNINNRFHIYKDIDSFYNFIDYIIKNNNTGEKPEININININPFYLELFNI